MQSDQITAGDVEVLETLSIDSHRGAYSASFASWNFKSDELAKQHFIVDDRVALLYEDQLRLPLDRPTTLRLVASERTKSLEVFDAYVKHLVNGGVRRGDRLVAIGGGVIQDITCFLAATLLRGMDWDFYPTTLLAQADSCIGSKSSINVGSLKNVLGTFTPPQQINIDTTVLKTLSDTDIRSGIGEMLKVHAIDGPQSYDRIAADYQLLLSDPGTLTHYIYRSLEIKRAIIEQDEFDRGLRNVMNYGHSFGHAIEAATNFAIPHGIAITIGMDMANYVGVRLGQADQTHYDRMHTALKLNFSEFEATAVNLDLFLAAISKDKKNTDQGLRLVLLDELGKPSLFECSKDARFAELCQEYLTSGRKG